MLMKFGCLHMTGVILSALNRKVHDKHILATWKFGTVSAFA
jgi:hypothetical protein